MKVPGLGPEDNAAVAVVVAAVAVVAVAAVGAAVEEAVVAGLGATGATVAGAESTGEGRSRHGGNTVVVKGSGGVEGGGADTLGGAVGVRRVCRGGGRWGGRGGGGDGR